MTNIGTMTWVMASAAGASSAMTDMPALSEFAGFGALGTMAWIVNAVIRSQKEAREALEKRMAEERAEFQERLNRKDARNDELMNQLIDKCPKCVLAQAANKSLIEDELPRK